MDKIIYGIIPQIQPTPHTCVQTCIAMALGVPVSEIIEKYGDAPLNQYYLTQILTETGICWNQFVFGKMLFDGWYFAAVPSLNFSGGAHQILIHQSFTGMLHVIDPSQKVKYREDGSDLISWSDLTPFTLPPRP
jgi:hypothetical protein